MTVLSSLPHVAYKVAEGLVESPLCPPSPSLRRVVRPPVLDMRQDNSSLRTLLRAALVTTTRSSNSNLCPMVCLSQHGLEKQCSSLVSLAVKKSAQQQLLSGMGVEKKTMIPSQMAHDLDDEDGPVKEAATELRVKLTALVYRILDILFDTNVEEKLLTSTGERLNGRMCLREYSATPTTDVNNRSSNSSSSNKESSNDHVIRLGAHIDHTLLTVLWSNGPGLEVFSPSVGNNNKCWIAEHVLQLGMPTISHPLSHTKNNDGDDDSCPPEPTEEDWAIVDIPWIDGALLLTIGAEWLTHPLFAGLEENEEEGGGGINCAVLHRVSMPINTNKTRYSLPFLVSIDKSLTTNNNESI